jgi:regulator of RNase E activity RraB
MKTAMQELRCLVQSMLQNGGDDDLWAVLSHIDDKLEKEKEQIMDAYENGYEACDMDEAMEVNKKLTSGDLYYNMNYNQNK